MDRPSSCRPLDDPHPDVVTGLGIGGARVAQSNDEAQRYFFFSASFFSALGAAAASFFSPALASPAGAAAPGAAATPSAPSTAALPFATTSGSFAPSGPTAALVSKASSLASDIGTATLTTICSESSR